MNVTVLDHPLINHYMTIIRNKNTSSSEFKSLAKRVSILMGFEVFKELTVNDHKIETPLENYDGIKINEPYPCLVSILRAGSIVVDGLSEVLPYCSTGYIGIFRDEKSLKPQTYFEKLPSNISKRKIFLCDPMLATGGSIIKSIQILNSYNCNDISIVSLLSSEIGIKNIVKKYPNYRIYTAQKDLNLNDKGFIVPGLGDAGDRLYDT
ncbi:MAG: uracil phosphoribosyltransferase [SAR116 cluster bacterium]|nr:uracil phosphoribosyltransferase [SAR116 cluster bacterium]RPH09088.1 MAG: uracil phosphoribosyltransferase [Alphaproteobacteria bacterium TMED54]